jgi:hypothetical protein
VATANAFTPDGVDGHFAWCIAQLSRAGILEALGADGSAPDSHM